MASNQKPTIDLEALYQAVSSFAGRVVKSNDPIVKEAANKLQAEVRRAKVKV
jgi:hypothetical protein